MSLSPARLTPEAKEMAEKLAQPRLGRYPIPSYDGASLPNVGVSAFVQTGGKGREGLLPPLRAEYRQPEDAGMSIVFLIDSFGWTMLERAIALAERANERALMGHLADCARPLTTVFPSTTSSALVSLSTGMAPGTHGIVGHTEYLPAWGTVLNMLRMAPSWGGPRDLAAGKGYRPQDLVSHPSLFRRGLGATALTKSDFEGTAFTKLLYDGAEFQGYVSLSDLSLHLRRILLRRPDQRPRLLWVYWDLLDAVHHLNGPLDELALSELTHLFGAVAEAASRMGPADREGISLYVTGDHGQVPIDPLRARAAHQDPVLMSLLHRPPSGEKRAAFLEAARGKGRELAAYLGTWEREGWALLPVADIMSQGILGPAPLHPELRDRLGDFLLLPPDSETLYYRPPGSRGAEDRFLGGNHGGLTREELLVPLVTTTMNDVAGW